MKVNSEKDSGCWVLDTGFWLLGTGRLGETCQGLDDLPAVVCEGGVESVKK